MISPACEAANNETEQSLQIDDVFYGTTSDFATYIAPVD